MKNLKEKLEQIGLDGKEANIYLQLLEKDQQTASQVAKKTGINRSVVYSVVERLLNKGLASYVIKDNVKHFLANDPQTLKHFLKNKERIVDNILPRLNKIKPESGKEVDIEVFQGLKGGIAIQKDIIREGKDFVVLGEDGTLQEGIPKTILEQYIRDLEENEIEERILAKKGTDLIESKYTKVRYLPKKFNLPTMTIVYGNKVAIAIFKKPYYIIRVRSKDLADTYRAFFENLWQIASAS